MAHFLGIERANRQTMTDSSHITNRKLKTVNRGRIGPGLGHSQNSLDQKRQGKKKSVGWQFPVAEAPREIQSVSTNNSS